MEKLPTKIKITEEGMGLDTHYYTLVGELTDGGEARLVITGLEGSFNLSRSQRIRFARFLLGTDKSDIRKFVSKLALDNI